MTPSTADDVDDVASPCISVCRMDPLIGDADDRRAGGLCTGCLRTIDEIVTWAVSSSSQKRSVLARVALRHARR